MPYEFLLLATVTAALYVVTTVAGWIFTPTRTRIVRIDPHRPRRALARRMPAHG